MATPPTEQVGTRLLFENDRVRVWDLALAPGEALEKHIHRLDYTYIVATPGLIRFVDPDNSEDYEDYQFVDDEVVHIPIPPEGKIDNRLVNIGDVPHRNFVIEIKRG